MVGAERKESFKPFIKVKYIIPMPCVYVYELLNSVYANKHIFQFTVHFVGIQVITKLIIKPYYLVIPSVTLFDVCVCVCLYECFLF